MVKLTVCGIYIRNATVHMNGHGKFSSLLLVNHKLQFLAVYYNVLPIITIVLYYAIGSTVLQKCL